LLRYTDKSFTTKSKNSIGAKIWFWPQIVL
jgi:hypothetical protein